jgi:hypothetical protein
MKASPAAAVALLPQSAMRATVSTTLRAACSEEPSRNATGSIPRLTAISSMNVSVANLLAVKPMARSGAVRTPVS